MTTVFESVRDDLLAEMRDEGPRYHGYPGSYPDDFPLPWDINNGSCETYGQMVCDRLPGAEGAWLDELTDADVPGHVVVIFDGRYYDAECVAGVDDWRELPICGHNPRPVP
jgi:hypothetical protein